MSFRILTACLLLYCLAGVREAAPLTACCPAPRSGEPVVNADQTVILLWDAANKMQHFIRKASFKSEADDFGFIVPSPTQPELAESGGEAFPYLQKLTEPEVIQKPRPSNFSCGCSGGFKNKAAPESLGVIVLDEKEVAGFHASVLEAGSATALVQWLKKNGYAFSQEIEVWAKPYVDQGWKFTALKVAKDETRKASKTVAAAALRISFQTDRPLFPYREPDPSAVAAELGAVNRLLRIYFIAEARYAAEIDKGPWSAKVAWAGKVKDADRLAVLKLLNLPETTGPAQWFLTEFENNWRYQAAPGDVYFSRSGNQDAVHREPVIQYVSSFMPTDVTVYALAGLFFLPLAIRCFRAKEDEKEVASE